MNEQHLSTGDLKWAAGFLEGEGSFMRNSSVCRISATQKQEWPLEQLRALFGGSQLHEDSRGINHWAIAGVTATGLMMTLYPMMSPRRKEQIARALEDWRATPVVAALRQACPQGHPYDRLYKSGRRSRRGCSICFRAAWRKSEEKAKSKNQEVLS